MIIIDKKISPKELSKIAKNLFGDMVKAVVDVEKEVVVLDAELHADEEALLLSKESKQNNLWGINLYPEFYGKEEFIEFDSMINIRPSQGNMSRGVDDEKIRKTITNIINNQITNK